MTNIGLGLLLTLSLSGAGAFVSGCGGGDEESSDDGSSTGGSESTGGTSSGENGSGGQAVSGTGGAPIDDYMSAAFSMAEADGIYTLEHGDVKMVVAPETAGRITSFLVAGTETLVQEGDAAEYGSTFWPSPQIWSWPPSASIPEIDPNPYTTEEQTQRLVLTSANNRFMGAIVTKTFGPTESAAGELGISVVYTIENTNAVELPYAAWEISRAASGVVFFPAGPGGVLEKSSLLPESANGHFWYTYDAAGLESVPKIFADGSDGWLAWAVAGAAGGTLVIKSFPDIPQSAFAANEAEIEIYADPSGEYMEVEQQGPVFVLQPGEILTWRVEWYGAGIADDVAIENGNQALVDMVTSTLGSP